MSTFTSSTSKSSSKSKSKPGVNKTARCISEVANWGVVKSYHVFDKPDAFIDEAVKKDLPIASPKFDALIQKIKSLDEDDMKTHGHLFKHMIFSGNPTSNHGAKMIASVLLVHGYQSAFRANKTTGNLNYKSLPLHSDGSEELDTNTFTMLLSKPLYGKPMTTYFKKHTLALFNMRPENIHGDHIRFICLDGGFREGIDLFDIKYIHLLEPTPINADERQAIGRGTRFCGQKGIAFDPKRGWPLYVYRYELTIPKDVQKTFNDATSFLELQLKYSNIDIREVVFSAELENTVIDAAVDKDLTKPIHDFKIQSVPRESAHSRESAHGGAGEIVVADLPFNSYLQPPPRIMNKNQMQAYVRKNFDSFMYPLVKLENGCMTGGAPQTIATFTKTQDFVRHFFQPSSAYKGMLMMHSVGTGKSCTGISTASTSWEKQGYTILWVTRHTLKADIAKNQYGIVCNASLQERLRQGKKVSKKDLSKAWLNPISYKQFSNMLLKKNKIYDDMVKRNGETDPLHKTLIIIDEAHKLYAPDTPAAEKPNMQILEKMLATSYASGKDSARLMLMTATPYTKSAMEMIQLLNLMRIQEDHFPVGEAFYDKYLNAAGEFTPHGRDVFQDKVSGYVSYLNRSADARNFAYPIIQDIKVDMSLEPVLGEKGNKYTSRMKELRKNKGAAREQDKEIIETCIETANTTFETQIEKLEKRLEEASEEKVRLTETCASLPKAEKAECNKRVKAHYNDTVKSIKQMKTDAKAELKNNKLACKQTKANIQGILDELDALKNEYDSILEEKKEINETIGEKKTAYRTHKEELRLLMRERALELAALKNINNKDEVKRKKELIKNKYAHLNDMVMEIKSLRQQLQKEMYKLNMIKEKIGTRYPDDVSQESALLKRCKLHIYTQKQEKQEKQERTQKPETKHASNDTPGKRNTSSDSYNGPTILDFKRLLQSAYGKDDQTAAKKVYRILAIKNHPDKHPNEKKQYETAFKNLQQAWNELRVRHNINGGDLLFKN